MTKTNWTSADYREASKRLAMGDILLPVSQVRSMLDFAANRIEADESAVPVAMVVSRSGDQEEFGERAIEYSDSIQDLPYNTPGPWYVGQDDTNGQAIVRGEHIEIATCWHHCVGSIEKEMRANARLIAAAPMLLEALVTAQWMLERDYIDPKKMAVIDKCRSAIATATQPEQTE